jgi:hypothetical protein
MARSERRRRAIAGSGRPARSARDTRDTAPGPAQPDGVARLLALQAGLGNQAVQRRATSCPSLSSCPTGGACDPCPAWAGAAPADRTASVSRPSDPDERAADRVADAMVEGSAAPERDDGGAGAAGTGAAGRGGHPLPPEARARFEPGLGDLGGVRIHTDAEADRRARELGAAAFSAGQDVSFAAGQYAPGTGAGRRLLAHELVHTRQAAEPGAPTGRVRRQQAPAEDPAARARRMRAISGARTAIDNLRLGLTRGYRWGFERVTPTGVAFTIDVVNVDESAAAREARLTRLVADLIAMVAELERGPAPAAWLDPTLRRPVGTGFGVKTVAATATTTGLDPEFEDTGMFYNQRAIGQGLDSNIIAVNTFYIDTAPIPVRERPLPRLVEGGVQTGIYIVVEHPDTDPMNYHRLTATENWPAAGTIFEVWHDRFGYYYLHRGQKHYLPERPGVAGAPTSR